MPRNKVLEKVMYLAAIGISVGMLLFVITCTIIGYEVNEICSDARAEYKDNCAGSLLALLEDETQPFRERNSAIWALGQLGDSHALPVLERYYTGNISKRESLSDAISQYELKKAITLAGGGLNLTAWAWDVD